MKTKTGRFSRLIAILLVIVMVLPLFPVSVIAAGTEGTTLSWTGTGTLSAGQTTYDLRSDTAGIITLSYATTDQPINDDIVLVVSCLEYGSAFKAIIDSSNNAAVVDAAWLNNEHTMMALRLAPLDVYSSISIQFETITIALTYQQCIDWMDNGTLPNTSLVAKEYRHTGSVDTVLQNGVLLDTCTFGSMVPESYSSNASVNNIYGYDVGVSSNTEIANLMLGNDILYSYGGYSNYLNKNVYGSPIDPYLYYEFNTAHVNQMPLIEITGIQVYVPGNEPVLRLTGIMNVHERANLNASNLKLGDFTEGYRWGNWTVGERQTDADGKAYYIITPPLGSRVFNNGTDAFFGTVYAGMKLVWQTSDDLPCSDTQETLLESNQTKFLYQLPSGSSAPDSRTYSHTGPKLHVWQRVESNTIYHAYNRSHKKNIAPLAPKTVRSSYTDVFTYTANTYYVKLNSDGTHVEYIPNYDGPIVQTYEFPYEIQPNKIYIAKGNITVYGNIWHMQTELADVEYTLLDGTVYHFSADQIAAVNAEIQSYSSDTGVWTELEHQTAQNPVKTVKLIWNQLRMDVQRGHIGVTPVYNLPDGKTASNSIITTTTQFTYNVSSTHKDGSPVNNGEMVQVLYDCAPAGSAAVTHYPDGNQDMTAGEDWLWFKLIRPLDPVFYGFDKKLSDTMLSGSRRRMQLMDGDENTATLAMEIGLNVGIRGERQDVLENPEISFHVEGDGKLTNSVGQSGGAMTDAERLIFFSGRLTGTRALSGWTFTYDLFNKVTGETTTHTYTVPALTEDTVIDLPHGEDEFFTTLSMKYEGHFDTGHPSDNPESFLADDTDPLVVLIKDMMLRNLMDNPFNGKPFGITEDYTGTILNVRGYAKWENCICQDDVHLSDKGQFMAKISANHGLPYCAVCYDQKITLISDYAPSVGPVETIYQGEGTDTDLDFHVMLKTPTSITDTNHTYSTGTNIYSYVQPWRGPWQIAEAVYIEIADPSFFVDPANSSIFGESLTGGNVDYETVSIGGKVYFKIRFKDDFIRETVGTVVWPQHKTFTADGDVNLYAGGKNRELAGTINLAFNTRPSVSVGEHHPIGKVYLDYSQLLDDYNAHTDPNTGSVTGAKDSYTKYFFQGSNLVTDEWGLSDSAYTDAKLWEYDFSLGSATPYKVNVLYAGGMNANIFPGKSGMWDYDHVTDFQTHEKDELAAVVTIHGPDAKPVYDLCSYIIIPSIDQMVTYMEDGGAVRTAQSDFDMYLRGVPSVAEQSAAGVGEITFYYTTETDPSASSVWLPLNETSTASWTAEQWDAVRGVCVSVTSMDITTKLDVQLDLRCDGKETLNILSAYSGGVYDYKQAPDGPPLQNYFGLAEWRYNNYTVTLPNNSRIWYDVYDENGSQAGDGETAAEGVTVTLYDTDGTTIIDTAVSDADGGFKLESWKRDAGSTLKLSIPDNWPGTWKPTKQSENAITAALTDSDFDRNSKTLVLPQLPNRGGLRNVSAGLVRLPEISTADITLYAGQTLDAEAILTDWLGMSLPEDSYNLTFSETAESAIARIDAGTVIVTGTAAQTEGKKGVTGISAGTTTATVTTRNTLGDEVTTTFRITVLPITFTVEKIVDGNDANREKEFSFTLAVPELAGKTVSAVKTASGGTSGTVTISFDATGAAVFTLAHGEKLSVIGLSYGAVFSISETDADGYTVSSSLNKQSGTANFAGTAITGQTLESENEIVFTNTRNTYGDLVVTKTVDGNAPIADAEFSFTVTLSDTGITGTYGEMFFENGVAIFTLKNGESKTASDLPNGISYTVEEMDYTSDGYVTTKTGATGTIVGNGEQTAAFTNTRNAEGSLTVSKTLEGNDADRTKDFEFTITLSDTTINGKYSGVTFTNGVATITLKGGESKTIEGLLNGTGYAVAEADYSADGYVTTKTGETGTIDEHTSAVAAFTNTRNTYGELTVTKTVDGNAPVAGAEFSFTVTLSDTSIIGTYGEMTFTNGVATFILKNGESKTATDLPNGITYEVTEADYTADGYVTTSEGAAGTITGGKTVTAAFTNTRNVTPQHGSLTVKKTVTGDLADKEQYYNFTITFDAEGSYSYTGSKSGTIKSGDTVQLKHGESITISDLPTGTTYSVTESGNEGYFVYVNGDKGTIAANENSTAAFTNIKSSVPQTGDDSNLLLWFSLMCVSGLGILLIVLQGRKRRYRHSSAR